MPAVLVLIGVKKLGDVYIAVTPAQIALTGVAPGCVGAVSSQAGSISAAASVSGVWRLRLIEPVPAVITLSADAGGINLPLSAPSAVITAGGAVQAMTLPVLSPPGEIAALGGCVAIWRLAGIIGAVPAGVVTLQAGITGAGFMLQPAAAQVAITGGMTALQTSLLLVPVQVQVAPGVLTAKIFLIPAARQSRYECRLSGNGLPDITIPVSSFTSRQRSGEPSFSEVTTPTLAQYFDIRDRTGGRFSIYIVLIGADKAILQRELLFESSLESISISAAGERQQVIISGYRTEQTNLSPQTIPISGVSYRSMYMGKIILRLYKPILYLKPGDTVIYGLDPIVAGLITYTMSAEFGTTVEISEAP